MSRNFFDPPLTVRDGKTLHVLSVERISTDHQQAAALDDQRDLAREIVSDNWHGPPPVWDSVFSRGSGERTDTDELNDVRAKIRSRRYDLLIVEDLGRLCRRTVAYDICDLAEDHDVRLHAINDNVDTAREEWRTNAFFAVFRHEAYNRDTAKRIRRTQRSRFKDGGILQTLPFGYEKPDGAKNDSEVRKSPDAEAIYDEWFAKLEAGASFSEIADWLNANSVATGGWCRLNAWTPQMVARITYNPLLKGKRERNRRMSRRINETGKRKSVIAPPSEHLQRNCPNLAMIEPDRYDRVVRRLQSRNAKFRRGKQLAADQRKNIPRKRTVWPGQSIRCGVCGSLFYYGAHGRSGHLMCSGARQYTCWNAVGPSAADVGRRITDAVWSEIERLPNFDQTMLMKLNDELAARRRASVTMVEELTGQIEKVERRIANLTETIESTSKCPQSLIDRLEVLEAELAGLGDERQLAEQVQRPSPPLPSLHEIKSRAHGLFFGLARDSQEFGRLMRSLLPDIRVYPIRLLDGGRTVLRANVSLCLTALVPEDAAGLFEESLAVTLVVDLFEPPQRVRHMEEVMRLTAAGFGNEREIAAALGITQPAVQRAKKLARLMAVTSVNDPYVRLEAPPEDDTKLRRHKHPRYRFQAIATA